MRGYVQVVCLVVAITVVLTVLVASRIHADPAERQSTLSVLILDVVSGVPVKGADVSAKVGELTLASGVTDAGGRVALVVKHPQGALADGNKNFGLEIEVFHLGYEFESIQVRDIGAKFATEIRMTPTEVIDVTVYASANVLRPATTLRGLKLQESLRSSVPETIAKVPGVAVAYNGPGAARPTIRGLGGDRVLMLENGFRNGDLYWSGADHGVMLEPLTAHEVEVVRGPATLVYGGNALGGVVNVIRHDIPGGVESLSSTVGIQVESASRSFAQGAAVVSPVGPIAARLEASVRRSSDVHTPQGEIPNTDVTAFGGSAGVGWHPEWGELGASVRYFQNDYGVPGEFGGVIIPGGHPGGAAIEARRVNGVLKGIYRPTSVHIDSVEFGASFTRYTHDEIEGLINGQKALGAAFELDSIQSNVLVRHAHNPDGADSLRGAAGIAMTSQDVFAGGNAPGFRSGTDWGVAGFLFEKLNVEPVSLHLGLRYEHRQLSPQSVDPISVRTADRLIEKTVTGRDFNLFSGSLAALWNVSKTWAIGTTVARSSRSPNMQELYSDGPHLADFSFDIGTPDLPSEVGTGVDIFVLAKQKQFSLEATGFVNFVNNYVQYTPTLETVRVIREGARPRDTPVFEARSEDALFLGAEGKARVGLGWGLSVEGTLSYVWAERRSDSNPLPFVPPLHGEATVRYERSGFFGSASLSGALRQSRVPRPIEIGDTMESPQDPTSGYALAHASAGWSGDIFGMKHVVTARAFNITDRVWRDHLSRIKDVAPQTGFNLTLTYQLQY